MDKPVALHEVKRILRPGARFVFTTWETDKPLIYQMMMMKDHCSLLRKVGFGVDAYIEPPDWASHNQAVYDGILAAEDTLIEEIGKAAAMP